MLIIKGNPLSFRLHFQLPKVVADHGAYLDIKFNTTGIIKKIGVRMSIKIPHCSDAWGGRTEKAIKKTRHVFKGYRNGLERLIDINCRNRIINIYFVHRKFLRVSKSHDYDDGILNLSHHTRACNRNSWDTLHYLLTMVV